MSPSMNWTLQRAAAWSGIAFILLVGIGWWPIAQFIPPHDPVATAEQVAEIYRQNHVRIRLGLVLALASAAFCMPFVASISAQMRRIEGPHAILSNTQLACGALGVLIFIIPMMIWVSLAYRPDRPAEVIQGLNDVGWFILLMTLSPAFVQNICIGIAILIDGREEPVFPRWAGFFNLWVAVLFIPAGMVAFFRHGPFAWNGLIAFWIPAAVFGAWIFIMVFLLLRAISRQQREAGEGALASA